MTRLTKRKTQLPIELRSLEREQQQLKFVIAGTQKKTLGLVEGWTELLTFLDHLPEEDSKAIVAECQVQLRQYPGAASIRAMEGFAHLHLGRPREAIKHFDTVIDTAGQDKAFAARETKM